MANFVLVKCGCGNEQKIFSTASSVVHCRVCNEVMAEPTGGEIALTGKRIKDVE